MPSQQTEGQVAQLRQIVLFKPPACPVSGHDVKQQFGLSGPAVGACLDNVSNLWVETDFTATREQLLAQLAYEIGLNKDCDNENQVCDESR